MKKEARYFIAIVPPAPIHDEALRWKYFFKDNFQSKASLNSPPHITLHMPFLWKEEKENYLIGKLFDFLSAQAPLQIQLTDFNCFEPRVIFIDVMKSEELTLFQKELERFCRRSFQLFNADYRDLAYHPHITLAFRDLKKQVFTEAWQKVKDEKFTYQFQTDSISLLKHNGSTWDILKELPLSASANQF